MSAFSDLLSWLYNLCFPFVFLALLPSYFWRMVRRGDYHAQFGQRLGLYSPEVRARLDRGPRRLWLQAVSVGEMLTALKLIAALREQSPDLPLILSTTTTTGFRLAQARAGANVEVIYSPVDLRSVVRRAFRLLRPAGVVIVDGGLWPNQLWMASRLGVSTALVNARLSPRSEQRFRLLPRLSRQIFGLLDLVCVPEETDVCRWESLGVHADKIHDTGSIKYDDQVATVRPRLSYPREVLDAIGVAAGRPILLAGSTHAGEEILIAEAYLGLRRIYPDLFLIVAPRHVERATTIIEELKPYGLWTMRRTVATIAAVMPTRAMQSCPPDLLLIDTTGELNDWYPFATIAFIGKSLTAIGGHNPAEAISAGKPVVVGPHMENFGGLVRSLLKTDAIIQIEGARGLQPAFARLLADAGLRANVAKRADGMLAKHRGAAFRSAALLLARTKITTC